ncbi:hypothetical protein FPV67DRAFT_1511472 [Lyophyllum atratum]|nr:hypothetical protein FPV67DRAFT_1511472 [Lyophyllum atratum]
MNRFICVRDDLFSVLCFFMADQSVPKYPYWRCSHVPCCWVCSRQLQAASSTRPFCSPFGCVSPPARVCYPFKSCLRLVRYPQLHARTAMLSPAQSPHFSRVFFFCQTSHLYIYTFPGLSRVYMCIIKSMFPCVVVNIMVMVLVWRLIDTYMYMPPTGMSGLSYELIVRDTQVH